MLSSPSLALALFRFLFRWNLTSGGCSCWMQQQPPTLLGTLNPSLQRRRQRHQVPRIFFPYHSITPAKQPPNGTKCHSHAHLTGWLRLSSRTSGRLPASSCRQKASCCRPMLRQLHPFPIPQLTAHSCASPTTFIPAGTPHAVSRPRPAAVARLTTADRASLAIL